MRVKIIRRLTLVCCTFQSAFIVSCQHKIVVPLNGIPIGKPYTSTEKYGVRLHQGVATVPLVQGVVDEVRDPDGQVINPIPDKPLIDPTTQEVVNRGFSLETSPTLILPAIDLSVSYKNVEVGTSTIRGHYLLWDFINEENFTLSYSPAFAVFKQTAGVNEEGLATDPDEGVAMEANSRNINNSILGSVRSGRNKQAQIALYGGLGLNAYQVSVEDRRSGEKKKKSLQSPTLLYGIYVKTNVFEFIYEVQSTEIPTRDGRTNQVKTNYATGGLSITF